MGLKLLLLFDHSMFLSQVSQNKLFKGVVGNLWGSKPSGGQS